MPPHHIILWFLVCVCEILVDADGVVRADLVNFPTKFLEDAEMAEKGLQVNSWTESVYT